MIDTEKIDNTIDTILNDLKTVGRDVFTYPEDSGWERLTYIIFLTAWPAMGMWFNYVDPSLAETIGMTVIIYTLQVSQFYRGRVLGMEEAQSVINGTWRQE